jgi:hypothetical protein
MREVTSLIERAKKYLKSSKTLLEEGDYESADPERIMRCSIPLRLHSLLRVCLFHLTGV